MSLRDALQGKIQDYKPSEAAAAAGRLEQLTLLPIEYAALLMYMSEHFEQKWERRELILLLSKVGNHWVVGGAGEIYAHYLGDNASPPLAPVMKAFEHRRDAEDMAHVMLMEADLTYGATGWTYRSTPMPRLLAAAREAIVTLR